MKILLVYSKFHYTPDVPYETLIYKNSSACILAKTLYELLNEFGDVEYLSFEETEKLKDDKYDIFIGISNNYDYFSQKVNAKIKIFFGVNQHYKSRNLILKNFKSKNKFFIKNKRIRKLLNKIKLTKFFNIFWPIEFATEYNLDDTNYIIVCGNGIVTRSYSDNGFDANKIYKFNYDILQGNAITKTDFNDNPKFIYIATELCLRKGYEIFKDLIEQLYSYNRNFSVLIAGDDKFEYYKHMNKRFITKYKDNVKYFGYLNSDDLSSLVKKSDFLIFPSLEEGQAGTVLDAMRGGGNSYHN